ncbi:MAG: flavin reductase [Oscillospiraceae bacterium]|nr:flavin reductase [Oscillospiraceae bacterium]
MALQKIDLNNWNGNPFTAIGKDWFLLTAGTMEQGFNFMTASWGQMGILWNQPSVTCYVRHSRYTFGFMEEQDTFTLTFLPESQRDALKFCGANSGRACDKVKETGLHPIAIDGGVSFEEAKLVLVCKKQFAADMDPADLPQNIADQFYANDAVHKLYIGQIVAAYTQA